MRTIPVLTTYLEMREPPRDPMYGMLPPGCEVILRHRCSMWSYRELYKAVGADWKWVDRLRMSDEELEKIITHPLVRIYVLYFNGKVAGYAETDNRNKGDIELAYFGLTPKYVGKGLGKYFLRSVVKTVWEEDRPERLWLHTCNLDHRSAIYTYMRSGFAIYDVKNTQQILSD